MDGECSRSPWERNHPIGGGSTGSSPRSEQAYPANKDPSPAGVAILPGPFDGLGQRLEAALLPGSALSCCLRQKLESSSPSPCWNVLCFPTDNSHRCYVAVREYRRSLQLTSEPRAGAKVTLTLSSEVWCPKQPSH